MSNVIVTAGKPERVSRSTQRIAGGYSVFTCLSMIVSMLMFLLFVLPLVTLFLRALGERGWEGLPESGLAQAIGLSIVTTAITTLLTFAMGTPLAYTLAMRRFPFARGVEILIEVPIVLPPAVAGLALLLLLGRTAWLGGLLADAGLALAFTTTAVVISQLFVSAPFYIRSAQVGFAGVPVEIIQAAQVDGAGEWRLFWNIMMPLARSSLLSGLVLSWARAMGEFGATILFAGSIQGRTQTMPLFIYNVIERDLAAAMWAGVILVIVALGALIAAQFLRRGEATAIV